MNHKKINWPAVSWLFLIFLFFVSCISDNEKSDPAPYIGTWKAQTEKFFPEANRNITMTMNLAISEDGKYIASGQAGLVPGGPDATIFTESGLWFAADEQIQFMAWNCAYRNGEGLADAPCEDPMTTIKIRISGQVWTWVEPDGFTVSFVRQ